MTATIAAVAGGGLALAVHDTSPGAPKDCGLVPCAAALPTSVRSGGAAPAGATATASPTASHRASTPSSSHPAAPAAPPRAQPASAEPVSVPEPLSSAPVASSAGRAVSANRAIGVGYAITGDPHHGIHGEFVIVNHGSVPVSGWRVTVVLPGDTGYQVQNAGNLSAGDALVVTAPTDGQALAGGGTELIAFTARGATSTPARCTFTESARPQATRDGSGGRGSGAARHNSAAGDQAGAARDGHDGWPGRWLHGWLAGSSPGSGWGAHGREGGWAGKDHGWPGGR